MQDFRKLRVWHAARAIAVSTYRIAEPFPTTARYTLAAQMRNAAVSIAANIAEGAGRAGRKDAKYFLQIAYGSACELISHYYIASDLGYLEIQRAEEVVREIDAIKGMLGALMNRLK